MRKIPTICPYCGCGCGIWLLVEKDQIVGTAPMLSHPVNQGKLCVKGWAGYEFVNSPHRLTQPLVKKRGKFKEVDWEEALSLVKERLLEIREKYGGRSIGVFSSAKCTNEENYLLMKFARAVLRTNNIDHCARLCHSSTVTGLIKSFGSGAMTNSLGDLEKGEVFLVIGSNTTENHPLIASRILRAVERGAKLIVADPRKIELTHFARVHLQQKPGTDIALLNGIMQIIIEEGLHNPKFIQERTEGFERFRETVKRYPPSRVEEITGVSQKLFREAARIYGEAERASIIYSMGITQHTSGTGNVLSCSNLALLCGQVGREGTGVNPLRGHSNVQGACDMGALPNFLSGYQRVEDEEIRKKFEKEWGVSLPSWAGLTIPEMIDEMGEGKIKALYIMGENPLLSEPDIGITRKAFEKLQFLVVQDIFLSETAQMADVVLPAASFAEKEGTITNTERRVQITRKALFPRGKARPDWEIILELANLMNYPLNYSSPQEITEEIRSLTPIYGGISYLRLEENFGLQWPCPTPEHPGTPILHRERFTRGKGKFCPVEYFPPPEEKERDFPLTLSTGRILFHFHTGGLTRRCPLLEREHPEGFVEISPQDASRLKIREGERVKVKTKRGEVITRARVTERVPPGTIFMPFHFRESPANLLTNPQVDPEAKIPGLKVCAARVEKLEGEI